MILGGLPKEVGEFRNFGLPLLEDTNKGCLDGLLAIVNQQYKNLLWWNSHYYIKFNKNFLINTFWNTKSYEKLKLYKNHRFLGFEKAEYLYF